MAARTPHRVRSDGSVAFSGKRGVKEITRMPHDEVVARFNASATPSVSGSFHQLPAHLPPLASTPPPSAKFDASRTPHSVKEAATPGRPSRARDRTVADAAFVVPDGLLRHDEELEAVVHGTQRAQSLNARLKLPQHMLSQRESVRLLEASLDQRLATVAAESVHEEVSRHDAALAAHEVMSDVAHELTRQVAAQCEERGRLLARVWLRYTDVVNSLTKAWEDEKQSHAVAEQQASKQLQQLRRDYATVVSHAESMLRESRAEMARVAKENAETQKQTNRQLDEAKAGLRRLQAEVRRALRSGELQPLAAAVDAEKLVSSDAAAAMASLNEHTAARRIRDLESQVRELDAQKRDTERQLVRLDLEFVDAKAEVARLRGFLRGTTVTGPTSTTQRVEAGVQVDPAALGDNAPTATPSPLGSSPRSLSPDDEGPANAPEPDALAPQPAMVAM
uniref:Uncharacterized protein n=1 Tax=Neobodo designis TaxID=312471 RepID=A0A7S1M9P7_NEODS|mmetsp:Transcript_36790/g.113504  ORF Transcript_36790/g.113504 Transcript_36790/m.113504 type:complete len:450 (+) Transcript_36790:47-1396(+)